MDITPPSPPVPWTEIGIGLAAVLVVAVVAAWGERGAKACVGRSKRGRSEELGDSQRSVVSFLRLCWSYVTWELAAKMSWHVSLSRRLLITAVILALIGPLPLNSGTNIRSGPAVSGFARFKRIDVVYVVIDRTSQ